MLSHSVVIDVLSKYPALERTNLVRLGNHGGFSGAQLWRIECTAGNYCLKAWPSDGRSPAELTWIHALMAQAAASWMPRVLATVAGVTFVAAQDRLWEVQTWMPGVADFAQAPSSARLQAAATALATLHQVWKCDGTAICPGVVRRMHSWRTWTDLVHSGWRPVWMPLDPYRSAAEPLWQLVQRTIDGVPSLLAPWLDRPVPVQPCVCDLWHDHVLFTGDAVTGIIDFGSVKIDHVAVDLARLFGSLIGEDDAMWEIGLSAYERIRPLAPEDRALARVLDRTGVILAATHWLRWLYQDMRLYDRPDLVLLRLTALHGRLLELA